MKKTENVNMIFVTHCNLRPPDAVPVILCFTYDVPHGRVKFEVAQLIRCCLISFYC